MKTSRVKFPRRVRIHGGECGAVARALHHAAQKEALMPYERISNSLISDEKALLSQADSGKALGSTFIERKQMSTKTTLKRIALVAVSALGFGVLSAIAPANAATVTAGATSSLATDTSSITLIAAGAPAESEYGVFEVSLTNSSGIAAPLGRKLSMALN